MASWWPFGRAENDRGRVSAAVSSPVVGPGYGASGLEAGAAARRLRNFRPGPAHVNTLIAAAGATVLQRARWLTRNNAYAINAADWWGNRVVGAGITPSWTGVSPNQKKALRQAWNDWTDEADAEGLTDFYGLQRRAAREMFIAGEVFFRIRYRRPEDGLSVPMQLQMLPAEMLDANDNRVLAGGNVVRQGIEFDRIGGRVAYYFWRQHPADSTELRAEQGQKIRVPANEVLHILDPVEAGQIRGLSRFSNVTAKLFTLDQYDDAELERKKTAALHAGFITQAESDGSELPVAGVDPSFGSLAGPYGDDVAVASLEPGAMSVLRPGESVVFSAPADVGGNFEAFQYRTLLAIASGLGVPYFALTGDTNKANYSSLRAALVDAKGRVEAYQWSVMIFGMCMPVVQAWLTQALLTDAVRGVSLTTYTRSRAKFRRVRWMPPPWAWADPLKELQAEVLAVEKLFKAPSDVMEANGFDAEETDQRTADDQARQRRLGIAPVGQNLPPAPDDDPVQGDEDGQTRRVPPEEE
ncbi:phage portal protein [Teichococcus deserti]|uniref:phage portal protein n=1 Tax=Teichococcus deserti TaxID=1817963 RepID=UPI0009FAD601|nr:phage portal protein [Pseudoroseomonas deserti]